MENESSKKDDLTLWMKEYGTSLLRMAYLYVNDRALAEDITQEAFIKAYQNYSSFRHDSSVKTWLTKITINLCKDALRNKKNAISRIDFDFDNSHLEESYTKKEEREYILGKIHALKPQYKEVIILYYYKNYSIKEIAEILQLSENTISTRLSRGRKKLEVVLKGWWENEK